MKRHIAVRVLAFMMCLSTVLNNNTLYVEASDVMKLNSEGITNKSLPKLEDYETYEIIDGELYVAIDYAQMMSEREAFETYSTNADYSVGNKLEYELVPKQADGITPEVGWEWSSYYDKFVKCSNDGVSYSLHTGQDYELYYCEDTCSTCNSNTQFKCYTCGNCTKLEDWLLSNTISSDTIEHIKVKNIEIPLDYLPFPITYFEYGSGYITNASSKHTYLCYWDCILNADGSPTDPNCNYNPDSWEILVNENDNAPVCWFKCDSLDYCNYDDHLYRPFDKNVAFEGYDDVSFGPAPNAPLTLPNSDISISGERYTFNNIGRKVSYTGRLVDGTKLDQDCNRGKMESKSKGINFNIAGSAFVEYTVWVDGCNHVEVSSNVSVSGSSKIERIDGNDNNIISKIQGSGVYVCSDENNTGWTRYRHTLDNSNSHTISYYASSKKCGTKVKKVTTVTVALLDVKIYYKVNFDYNNENKTIGNDNKYNNTDAAIRYEDELLWTESNPNPKYRPFPRPMAYYTINLYPSGSNGTYTTSFDEPSWDSGFLSRAENTPTQSHNKSGVSLRTDNGLTLPQLNTTETQYWGQDGKSAIKTKYWASRVYSSFEGWWTAAVGGSQKVSTDTVTSSGTLYSHWVNNSVTIPTPRRRYTITYDTYGGNFIQEENIVGHDDYTYGGVIADNFIGNGDLYTDEDGNKIPYENKRYTTEGDINFLGWYDQSQSQASWFTSNQNGNIYDTHQTGNYKLEQVVINNKVVYRYTPVANTNMYAHWMLPDISIPSCYKLGYEFLGWYTIPQPSVDDMQNGNMNVARYAGGHPETDDNMLKSSEIDLSMDNETNIHLYAWYNRKPIFVDIYEGLFFEGQQVTYDDLLNLVGVFDYEDNYLELQQQVIEEFFEEKINKIDQDIEVDKDLEEHKLLEKDTWIYKKELAEDGEHNSKDYANIIENIDRLNDEIAKLRDKIAELFKEKEQLEQEREKALESIPERARLLDVHISEIDYYGTQDTPKQIDNHRTEDETSCGIFRAPDYTEMDYETNKLKTNTDNIGKFEITYQVHDEGIKFKDVDGTIKQIPKSDVTLEYTRTCQINFNYNPLLYTQGVIQYTSEVDDTTFADNIKLQQAVFDSEDTQDNIPWWGKYEANSETTEVDSETGELLTRKLLHDENDNTIDKLQKTLVITGVTGFKFTTAFAYEHQDIIDKFIHEFDSPEGDNSSYSEEVGNYYVDGDKQPIIDKSKLLNHIASFKNDQSEYSDGITKNEVWEALTNIHVTFDAIDQWGKMASNGVTEEAHDNPDTFVDTTHTPAGYIPEYNSGNDTGDDNPDPNKPYDKIIYQSEPERSIDIIMVNDGKNTMFADASLFKGLIKDKIRYVNANWIDTLGTSYWGTYGKEVLRSILQKNTTESTQHAGYYNTNNKDKVVLNITDYSK